MKHQFIREGVVPVTYRSPFASKAYTDIRKPGQSILEIVQTTPQLPKVFMERGVVLINGQEVPRDQWAVVRPKPTSAKLPIAVTMHLPLAGGKNTTKSIIGIVAALALVVVTAGIASFGIPFLGLGIATIGTFGATALAGAVGIAGALAIAALTKPPSQADNTPTSDTNTDQKEAASASGNLLQPGGPIPRVLGTRRIYPPLAAEPIIELIEDDEFIEAVYVLNGPHLIEDLRLDGVPIDSTDDVDVESTEGFDTDDPLTLTVRQGRTKVPNLTLSKTKFDTSNSSTSDRLLDQATPANSLPIWHGFVSRKSPDQIWMHLTLPSGISLQADQNIFYAFPIRMRMRRRGDSAWINFPEFHISDASVNQIRCQIKIMWDVADPGRAEPPLSRGFVEANIEPPLQGTTGGISPGSVVTWLGDSYFDGGGSDRWLINGNAATTRITNMNLYEKSVEFYIDPDVFPKGTYEVQLMRGYPFFRNGGHWSSANYKVDGNVYDFFYYYDTGGFSIAYGNQFQVTDTIIVNRFISIWNEYPVPLPDGRFAHIAIKAQNRAISNLSCSASGLVQDWDGDDWTDTYAASDNPATHYHDVLSGALTKTPLPDYMRDDDKLLEWRQDCIDHAWTVNTIVEDSRTQDVLELLASCGYARPYQSDIYGVVIDKSRVGDVPVQVFSETNSRGTSFEKAFSQVPRGFIITYRDEENDDDQAQTVITQRDESKVTANVYESVSYEGLIEEATVRARAQFDLDQALQRSTFYNLTADVESLVCRKGDLVALNHSVINHWHSSARIKEHISNAAGTNFNGFVLTSAIQFDASEDLSLAIRRRDGTITTHSIHHVGPVLQMTFDTENGFVDESSRGHTITAFDNAHIGSSAWVTPFGTASMDGSGDYLVITDNMSDFNFGTDDFTIDFWIMFGGGLGGFQNLYDDRQSGGNFVLSKNPADKFTNEGALESTTIVVINTWYHVAYTRRGTDAYLFINGITEDHDPADSTNHGTPVNVLIGAYPNGAGPRASFLNGRVDQLRVVKGRALWVDDFTPPVHFEEWNDVYLDTPFALDESQYISLEATDGKEGSLVVAGEVTEEYKRLLVAAIEPQGGLTATLTLIDEGTDLVRYNAPFFYTGFEVGDDSEFGSHSGLFDWVNDDSIAGLLVLRHSDGDTACEIQSYTGFNKTSVRFSVYIRFAGDMTGTQYFMGLRNSSNQDIARVHATTVGDLGVWINGDRTTTDFNVFDGDWHLIEFRYEVDDDFAVLYADGTTVWSESGFDGGWRGNVDRSFIACPIDIELNFDEWTMTVPA